MTVQLNLGILGRRRVSLVRQSETAECGLACLTMVARFYRYNTDLAGLRRQFSPSMRGATLRGLIGIADAIGLIGRPVKLPLVALASLQMPAILHWNMNHFVVIERVAKGRVLISDPATGKRWLPMAEVSNRFTGIALELRPAPDFSRAIPRVQLRLSSLWQGMVGWKRAAAQTLTLTLILQAFVLAAPFYLQVSIDSALPALDYNLLTTLAVGFGLFTVVNAGVSLLRSYVLLSAGTLMGYGIAVGIARRLFRLPVVWFERRHVSDILSRFQSVQPIQDALTQGLVASLVDGLLAIFTLVLMMLYSPFLASVAIGAILLYATVRLLSFGLERDAREDLIIAGANEQSVMIESLRGIITLRLFSREAERHILWQAKLSDSLNASVSASRIAIWQSTSSILILGLENVLTICLSIRLVMSGGFSVGMVFAYLSYKTQFLTKAASLVDKGIAFWMLGLHLERLGDIALEPEDIGFASHTETTFNGGVTLKDLSYRYSPADPLVINGVDLVIGPGEYVAITGPSGGGKTTLARIILGLVEPDVGEVLIDGLPLSRFGHRSYRSQIAAVMQDDSLFAGSIASNIALFEETLDLERISHAACLASIHDDIKVMPMGYETFVGDMGSVLSGGQKARILLARALYRRPRLILLDEGTAHLDVITEMKVNDAIANLGITRIVIAHREETIRSADRVLFMKNGKLLASGTEGSAIVSV